MEVISSPNESYSDKELIKDEIRIPRPPNAFMIFGKDYRKILANKFQNLSNKQISKILGDEWKKMDAQTKEHYHRLAEEAHRQHLDKHPGYYYSPLEARQRKAERKRNKMSKTNHKSKGIEQIECQLIQTFGGNRPFVIAGPLHPTLKPIFGTPIVPRMRFVHPIVPYGPTHPFGGFSRRLCFAGSRPMFVTPINAEHSYAAQPKLDISAQQTMDFEMTFEPQINEIEVQNSDNTNTEIKESVETADIGMLSSFLPPMHNPNNEVNPVIDNENHFSDQTNHIMNGMTGTNVEVTKMVNVVVDNDSDLLLNIKKEVTDESLTTGPNVVVEAIH